MWLNLVSIESAAAEIGETEAGYSLLAARLGISPIVKIDSQIYFNRDDADFLQERTNNVRKSKDN